MPSRARPAVAARPYHHGNLRESLLAAADGLLAERGAAGFTLREVAKRAGVSHAAPYHHFASLDALLAAIAERAFNTLADAMARASRAPEPRQRLLAICEAYVVCARRQPAQFRLMFGPMLAQNREHPGLKQAANRAFDCLLQAARAQDPLQAEMLALTGWSLAHGLANLLIDGAFDALPIKAPSAKQLARAMAAQLLPRKSA
ncbi:MAG: helix-turn-helix transcriptional regulator [Burkholderiales bacterium]|nr:helix-turn-helix transcriptional regulator [Burkholderiales bacterium]